VAYDCQTDMVQILQATLSVLEHNEFAGKNEKSIAELTACLRETILVLDQLSRVPPVQWPNA
jgi:hypothetical protein